MDSDLRQALTDLRNYSPKIRRKAVVRIGNIGGDTAVRTLITVIQNDHEDPITRGRAALMLGKLRDARAVPDLIAALEAPGRTTPVYAAQALGKIGDPSAIAPLLKARSGYKNDDLPTAAQEALVRLGYTEEATA